LDPVPESTSLETTLANEVASKVWPVVRVAAGNCLEMYDFQIFGYYAAAIGGSFFPSGNEYAALMASLTTFGAGFLMRPLGAVVLGPYLDHRGRRAGLLLTLTLMAVGTLSIACMPSYSAIGLLAPMLILTGRLIQGISAGVENGGVSVYLSEIATAGHKGFYVSWQTASQQVGVIAAALLGLLLTANLSQNAMTKWGWRIPMLAGCAIIPLLFLLRRSLEETQTFRVRRYHPTPRQILRTLVANWRLVLLGVMLVTTTTVYYYMITAYTPTFGSAVLHLAFRQTMMVTLCVGASNLFWVPIMGSLSDRIGRRPILVGVTVLTLLTAYPTLWWLASAPSMARLLTVELWLSCLFGGYTGAMVVFLTEIMPMEVRTTGFSFAYSCATACFGGFTPAICTLLIHTTGNRAIPGLWLSFAATCGLIATSLLSPERLARISVGGQSRLTFGGEGLDYKVSA
jgi:MFS transporter, MHS family, citrate/tricarballylate:H+ symporter